MDALLGLIAVPLVLLLPVGAILGLIAFVRSGTARRRIAALEGEVAWMRRALDHDRAVIERLTRPAEAPVAPPPASPGPPTAAPAAAPATQPATPAPASTPVAVATPAQGAPMHPAPPVPSSVADAPVPASGPVEPFGRALATPRAAAAPPQAVAVRTVAPPASPPVVPPAPPVAPPPPPPPAPGTPAVVATDAEAVVGKRWLTWSGMALLFLGAVFLLKYAYDQDWLGRVITPPLRIALIGAGAAALLAWGLRLQRRGMAAIGQGVAGGAIALGYLCVYGAWSPKLLIVSQPLLSAHGAFALMAAITALGVGLAVRRDALAMSVMALIGGFATPVLISTGGGSRDGLFAYVLLLDLGVLAAALYRRWRLLDVLAFAGTVLLWAGWWHHREPHGAGVAWAMLVWLGIFHLVFLALPFLHHWRARSAVTVERFALALGNLAFGLAYAGVLLRHEAPRVLALVCLGLAALYTAVGVFTRRRIPADGRVVHGFLALGAMLLTLSLFYLLPVEAIATGWAAEAVVLLWLGYRYAHAPTRLLAHGVLALAVLRLAAVHLPQAPVFAPLLVNAWLPGLLVAPLAAAAFALVHRRCGAPAGAVRHSAWIAAGLLLVAGTAELVRHHAGHASAYAHLPIASALAVWWAAGGIGLLVAALRTRSRPTALIALLPALVGAVSAFAAYGAAWPGGAPVANLRCAVALAALAVPLAWAFLVHRRRDRLEGLPAQGGVPVDGVIAIAQLALALLATLETAAWCQRDHHTAAATSLHQALTWVWIGTAAAGILAARATGRAIVGRIAVVPLALALPAAFALYLRDAPPLPLLANGRFLAGAAAIAVLGMIGMLRRDARGGLATGVQLLATGLLTAEAWRWCADHDPGRLAGGWGAVAAAAVWSLSAMLAAARWARGAGDGARVLGIALMVGALLAGAAAYGWTWRPALPVLNARALAMALAIAAVLAQWAAARRRLPDQRTERAVLAWLVGGAVFAFATIEPWSWATEGSAGRRIGLFAITMAWVVLASAALAGGFRWRQRALRIAALVVFALTAAKLLLVDLHGVPQLYRILAFLLTGAVLIAASYAYHRFERRLTRG